MENYVGFLLFVKILIKYGEKNCVYFKRLILVNIIVYFLCICNKFEGVMC